MAAIVLKLYVSGRTPRSRHAVENLQRLCTEATGDAFRVEVIDVLEQPELAEQAKILATPTLVKNDPPPSRRLIGDLSDLRQVLDGLELWIEGEQP